MLIIVKYTVINLLKERANTMDGKEIKMKWRMDDEFINFLKKFEKIGEIEKGTVLMGVENYDFEGCLTYVKLYFICDEKEADAFRFYDKSYTRSHIKGYRSFKDDLKKEKELLREELEKKTIMEKLNQDELTDEDYEDIIFCNSSKLTEDEVGQIVKDIDEKIKSDEMQNEIFVRVAKKVAKNIAQYYINRVVHEDIYTYGKIVNITVGYLLEDNAKYLNHLIQAAPVEEEK